MVVNLETKAIPGCRPPASPGCLDTLQQVPLDCLGVDLQGALEALGEVTGENLKEEVIDRIFHEFCIGK